MLLAGVIDLEPTRSVELSLLIEFCFKRATRNCVIFYCLDLSFQFRRLIDFNTMEEWRLVTPRRGRFASPLSNFQSSNAETFSSQLRVGYYREKFFLSSYTSDVLPSVKVNGRLTVSDFSTNLGYKGKVRNF